MPTRKQKRRRQKDRRHDWEYVYVDDEGREVEVEEEPAAADAKPSAKQTGARPASAKSTKQPAAKGARPKRPLREPAVPSWGRSFRRAVPWQVVLILAVLFVLKSGPLASRLSVAIAYSVLLVPFMFWMDKMQRDRWLRATGQLPPKQPRQPRQPREKPPKQG